MPVYWYLNTFVEGTGCFAFGAVFSGVECRGEEVASGEDVVSGDSGSVAEAGDVALLEEMPEFCLATRGV